MKTPLYAVTIETGLDFSAVVETGLECLGLEMVSWTDVERQRVTFQEFLASRAGASVRVKALREALASWATDEQWTVEVRRLRAQDWSESWKRFFRTERISPRLVVKPSWERYRPAPGERVVVIDPGLSFGTGQHFTTRSCLRFIDEIALQGTEGQFLDLGCGSGILGIAAAKLGFKDVLAVDNDPEALAVARENVSKNRVAARVSCKVADIAGVRRKGPFRVIVANILAGVLREHAAEVAGMLDRHAASRLCLAGILAHQYPGVRDAYLAAGLREVSTLTDGEWMSGCFGPA
jgi:ribosomal protein L11 methyltransferase